MFSKLFRRKASTPVAASVGSSLISEMISQLTEARIERDSARRENADLREALLDAQINWRREMFSLSPAEMLETARILSSNLGYIVLSEPGYSSLLDEGLGIRCVWTADESQVEIWVRRRNPISKRTTTTKLKLTKDEYAELAEAVWVAPKALPA